MLPHTMEYTILIFLITIFVQTHSPPPSPLPLPLLPEGVSVGSGIMMAAVYAIFQDFEEWLIAIHDDILIAAHGPEDMAEKIKRVFQRCAEVGVQPNIKK